MHLGTHRVIFSVFRLAVVYKTNVFEEKSEHTKKCAYVFSPLLPPSHLLPRTGSQLPQNLYLACSCPDSNTERPFCSKAQGHLAVIFSVHRILGSRERVWLAQCIFLHTVTVSQAAGQPRNGSDPPGPVSSGREWGWGWNHWEGLCGDNQVQLAQDLGHRTPQINSYQGGDRKFRSSYEGEVMIDKLFSVTSAVIQGHTSLK